MPGLLLLPLQPSMSATAVHADPIRKYLETARTQIAQGALREAAQTLNQAQRILPGDARIFMLAGLMAEKSGNIKGAFEALRKCVAMAPGWGPGLLELALLLARQNQFPEAVETAEKVAALEPKNLRVLAGVVDSAHRAGHAEMALKHLRRSIDRKGRSLGKVVKTGRTHLMDAMPLTFAQEFGAWSSQLASAEARLADTLKRLIANISKALQHVRDTAEQFKESDRWRCLLRYISDKIAPASTLTEPPQALKPAG